MKKLLLVAAATAALSTPAAAQSVFGDADNEALGEATATVIAPITLTHVDGAALAFGSFTVDGGGTIAVTQAGVPTATGPTLMSDSVSSADSFTVSGDEDRAYSIDAAGGSVTDPVSGDSMSFTVDAPAGGTLTGGTDSFDVGGTLTVVGDESAGSYSGTYEVSVSYN
ncbi:DUF4402 domain-containing protein [Aurantiacibacter spongiae]|uniref:DUF4402 domain-containing protein n=1 Tax=Aurantiacibacter spongiae TaxID=2488860 RepID=A0A3N5CSZ0_9SPHN|nr:DUF4402 domain-containing protein [Aurantiacibacter spongiae]RPF72274.1 DUF4402 domain-containing protein [Aurantiacibacter spongiae]